VALQFCQNMKESTIGFCELPLVVAADQLPDRPPRDGAIALYSIAGSRTAGNGCARNRDG
jgi:hypothetical protein